MWVHLKNPINDTQRKPYDRGRTTCGVKMWELESLAVVLRYLD